MQSKKSISPQHIYAIRKDKTRYLIAQVGDSKIDGQQYYRYYYADVLSNGRLCNPSILYSDTNVTHLIDAKNFNKNIPQGYEEAVDNILFSRENIFDSKVKGTGYIGKVTKDCSRDINVFRLYNREFGKAIEEVRQAMYNLFLPNYKKSFIITPIALYFE